MQKQAQTQTEMRLPTVFFLGVNGIIGSGIFLLPGHLYQSMGVGSILVMLAVAVSILTIVLCYANMASKITGNGAAWLYTYNAFGRFAGFEVGIFTWLLGIVTLAAEISAFLTMLTPSFPVLKQEGMYLTVALGLLFVLIVINFFGPRLTTLADNLSAGAKVAALALFIGIGVFFVHGANFSPLFPASNHLANNFSASYNQVFYMFSGFAFLPITAARMKNPAKNVPIALISVLVTCSLLYMAAQAVAIGVLGSHLSGQTVPIAAAFGQLFGQWGYDVMLVGMAASILGVAVSVSYSTPVVASSLASEHNLLPQLLGKTNRYGAPTVALIFTGILCALLLMSGDYFFLISCMVFTSFLQYVPTVLASIKFRKDSRLPKGFDLPGGLTIPILGLLTSAYLLTNFTWLIVGVGILIFILAAVWYRYDDLDRQKHQRKRDVADKDHWV